MKKKSNKNHRGHTHTVHPSLSLVPNLYAHINHNHACHEASNISNISIYHYFFLIAENIPGLYFPSAGASPGAGDSSSLSLRGCCCCDERNIPGLYVRSDAPPAALGAGDSSSRSLRGCRSRMPGRSRSGRGASGRPRPDPPRYMPCSGAGDTPAARPSTGGGNEPRPDDVGRSPAASRAASRSRHEGVAAEPPPRGARRRGTRPDGGPSAEGAGDAEGRAAPGRSWENVRADMSRPWLRSARLAAMRASASCSRSRWRWACSSRRL
jgi:hypothetical protein